MKSNNLLYVCLVLTALFFGALFAIALFYTSRMMLATDQNGAVVKPIIKDNPVFWPIPNRWHNIATVVVHLRNEQVANTQPQTFSLQDTSGVTLTQVAISGSNVVGDDWVKFQFAPVNVQSDQLLGVLASETATGSAAVQVYTDGKNDVAYKSYARLPIAQASSLVASQVLKRFFADRAFATVYFVLIAAVVGWLLWFVRPKRRAEHAEPVL